MLGVLTFIITLATVRAQLGATGLTTVDDIDASSFNNTNVNQQTVYEVPGANPGLSLTDSSGKSARYQVEPVLLYQGIFIVSPIVCKEDPTKLLEKSFILPAGSMTVAFIRVRPNHKTITYGELCTAMRGIAEYITRDSVYYELLIRLTPTSLGAVNCDVAINKAGDATQASFPAQASVQAF